MIEKPGLRAIATFDFDWENRRVRLGVVNVVWVGVVAEGAGDDGTHAGFVCCDDEQQFQRSRLYTTRSSKILWCRVRLCTYPPIDLELVCFALLLNHEQCMVKQEH